MDTSNFSIQTRSRGIIQDDRADPSSSTPNAYQTDHRRHDGQFVKPTTPEQLEEIVLTRIAAVAPAARSRSSVNFFDTSHGSDDLNVPREDQQFHRQVMPKEVPLTAYRNTTLVSCDILKANKLTEYGHDNLKRKELILKVLRTEDLLTMVTKKGNVQNAPSLTPLDILQGKCSQTIMKITSLVLMTSPCTHMTSPDYMWPSTLQHPKVCNSYSQKPRHLAIEYCFGNWYWQRYSGRHIRILRMQQTSWDDGALTLASTFSMTYIILCCLSRANETSKSILPESILDTIYEEISKDPREELIMISTFFLGITNH